MEECLRKKKPVLPENSEQELIEGLINELEDAQRGFFNQYYEDMLHHLSYSGKARCKHDTEDITIETFYRAFRDIKRFRAKSSLRTWLFRIADHAAVDFYRSPKNRYSAASLEENTHISPPTTYLSSEQGFSDPTSEILEKEKQEKIQECLQQLSEQHRMVITLRLFDGCSVKETAQIMGKTEGAIKMLFFRAWGKLTKIIKEHPYFIDYQIRNKIGGSLQ